MTVRVAACLDYGLYVFIRYMPYVHCSGIGNHDELDNTATSVQYTYVGINNVPIYLDPDDLMPARQCGGDALIAPPESII